MTIGLGCSSENVKRIFEAGCNLRNIECIKILVEVHVSSRSTKTPDEAIEDDYANFCHGRKSFNKADTVAERYFSEFTYGQLSK